MRNPKGIKYHQIPGRNSKDILKEKCNEHIKIFTDGSKKDEKVGCAVIVPDQKFRKRLKPQNTVYSTEQKTIIKVIYVTQRTGEWRVITTDSLSRLMAMELKKSKNIITQKTTGRRKRESHPSLGARPYGNTKK
jgi:hypothetical protein